jgi:hypothetical protein
MPLLGHARGASSRCIGSLEIYLLGLKRRGIGVSGGATFLYPGSGAPGV